MLFLCFDAKGGAKSGIGYSVTEVPLEPLTTPLVNDKGQVVILTNGTVMIYQPAPDYGRPAGVHNLGQHGFWELTGFNTNGTIVGSKTNGAAVLKDGQLTELFAYQVLALNNADQILGRRAINPPEHGLPEQTYFVLTLGGSFADVVRVLPHVGLISSNSGYHFTDLNDHGIATGGYFQRAHMFDPGVSYGVLWDTAGTSVRRLPPDLGGILINNKNQSVSARRVAGSLAWFLYLPEPDYGLTAGFHDPLEFAQLNPPGIWFLGSKLTDHGDIFINRPGVNPAWYAGIGYRDRLVDPSEHLTDGKTSDLIKTHDVNNKGVVLGTGAINGRPNRLLLYRPLISAMAEIVPERITRGETFEMRVTISNESDAPFVLAGVFGESYTVTGSALPGLQQLANPPASRFIAPGESWRQDFPFRANRNGDIQFSFQVAGFHAGGIRFLTDRIEPSIKVGPVGDLLIKKAGEPVTAYSGNDLYLPEMDARQHRYAATAPGETNQFQVRIENDSELAERLVLRASAVGMETWEVKYFRGATDITASVFGSGWITPDLPAGGSLDVGIRVRDVSGAAGERLTLRSAISGTNSVEVVDAVTVISSVAEVPITTEIKRVVDGGYTGTSVTNGLSNVDAPLELVAEEATLASQPTITGGWVADGVTPLLVQMAGDPDAVAEFPEGRRFRMEFRIAGGGELKGEDLSTRLRLLKGGAWVASDEFELKPGDDTVFAMLTPVASDEVELGERTWQLTIAFTVKDIATGGIASEGTWLLRKPPVALIHGYNTPGDWGYWFMNELGKTRPIAGDYPWIQVVKYGQNEGRGDYVAQMLNTLLHLSDLVPMAEAAFEEKIGPLREQWAFTRFDAVCHSQGGLLTRMLCSRNSSVTLSRPFRNELNFNRGRFHRVVTIGSPHNGTRLLRFLLALNDSNLSVLKNNLPTLIGKGGVLSEVAQEKFDPFGLQIRDLNNPAAGSRWAPDLGAKFHLVRSTINEGRAPHEGGVVASYLALGLIHPASGPAVIPRGSDGVVDFDSMGAHGPNETAGDNVFTLPSNFIVSHSGPLFAFGSEAGQTDSVPIAEHVRAVLDQDPLVPAGDRVLGSFHVPALLEDSVREGIDHWADATAFEVAVSAITAEAPPPPALGALATGAPGQKRFVLPTAENRPPQGLVSWMVETFTKDGVGTGGVTLQADPLDSRRVLVSIPDRIAGDVVLYANYVSTNGAVVLAAPMRIYTAEPAGVSLVGIEAEPNGGEFPAGVELPVQITARYSDGRSIVRHVTPDEVTAATSAPGIVSTTNSLNWRTASSGSAQIVVGYRGFFATNSVTVVAASSPEAPSLTATRSGANVVLRWPASATGYVLEWSTNIAPGMTWELDAGAPVTAGESKTVTREIDGRRFFRLRAAPN